MKTTSGKITLVALLGGIGLVALFLTFYSRLSPLLQEVTADTATTTVTVLNTPPLWAVDAEESAESSTSTPTNAGSNVSFVGTATDPNAEQYYLLICKSSSTPTANAGAAPTCGGGGSNLWAVSSATNSGSQATATYTTQASDPEDNPWFAWICDGNAVSPQCNGTFKQGSGTTASPFVVNHRPTFTSFTDDSPRDPGALVTWSATSSDSDTFGAADTVRLFVCKSNDFTGTACGAAGTYCSSGFVASNPTCNFTLENPKQDQNYTAFGYVIDNHNFAASGGAQNTDSVLTVANVAPAISSSTISLLDTDDTGNLTLTVPQGQTSGFKVTFTVTDNNSCQNAASGNEIASNIINVYRSGVGVNNCQATGQYNANSCYPGTLATTTWNVVCTQNGGSCSGASDATATFTCTFPLWYVADPTDGSSGTDTQFFNQNWLASVKAIDDNNASSSVTEAATGNEVSSFLAYSLSTPTIAYGSFSPGFGNATLNKTTTLAALGNVGLDETLYGDHMCTTYPSCNGASTTSTIAVGQQQYATSSLAYGSGISLVLNPGALFSLAVPKTITTSTPQTRDTFWGIQVPSTITLAGDYTGRDTVIGVKSPATTW